ncbi:MAG TPA: carbon starvation CstA family protein [Gemmatimonadales bacterium]|jgi:carbon starvation protein|nr:carbon starvation CstA family protein [Gemmatimonadales bacterium]
MLASHRFGSFVLWGAIATLGAVALGVLALFRGESINAAWLLIAAVCTYVIGFRFYSKFLATRVFGLDARRATPAERFNNGRDFVPTDRWVLFGHHFAAIAGAGPLVGPVLAAQFGFLPGTLWLVIGVVLGGAVQDFTILFCSLRRDGKSLGQMAKEEVSKVTGVTAMVAVLAIMIILLAVLALIVVNALRASPWGLFTIACTVPIALLMGWWMKRWRPGKVGEASAAGAVLLLGALVAGGWVANQPAVAAAFTHTGISITWMMIAYGFIASVLPVWMLLCPRDYLSTFLKITTVLVLGAAILIILPPLRMPALTPFATAGEGPVFAGKLFPFAFITIACGAISGFHSLIASGTTPKMLAREPDARMIGYGGMLMESFVGVMAMIAACTLDPGVYFAMNTTPAALAGASDLLNQAGFVVTPETMQALAAQMGEQTLVARTGGAPSLAVGMAHIFSGLTAALGGKTLTALWYHFAIMFEALFILTTIDTGTRVGRFMLQEIVGHVWPRFGQTSWYPSVIASSAAVVAGWGYFLYQGVVDPLGGINSLWPLFGISNQLLAAVALCVGTTILIKMGRQRYAWVTLAPLAWVIVVTMTAGWQKVFSADPKLGFLAHAASLAASADPNAGRLIFNDRLNTVVALFFMVVVALLIATSAWEWWLVLSKRKAAVVHEAPYVETALAVGD